MKKLNMLFILSLTIIVFGGCAKDDEPTNADLLQGTWVNTMVNEQPVLTDATFIMKFNSDLTQLYAAGFQMNDNNKSWHENSNYTYSVSSSLINIEGTDVLGNSYKMVFKIISLDQDTLTYSILTFLVNGEAITNTNTYTCKRVRFCFILMWDFVS